MDVSARESTTRCRPYPDSRHTGRRRNPRGTTSVRSFARRFVAETGTAPHSRPIRQRVPRARHLLEENDIGVEQIAERVGFLSALMLRGHFRRIIGLAPTEYPPAASPTTTQRTPETFCPKLRGAG
ncbi:helix-turn-helix domain-containing protein [Nocardia sp. NPDC057440]|uniref:helix-turn-helix domain-containing protein n=1 Tax=Nocardia sp. NPDC057440 TaxID=3346134 RepID=UPI00366F67A4